jgi:hypothetical protein
LGIPGGSLELFLELLELFLGLLATRSRLLRELFCFGLLCLVQLYQLFLTRWYTITSLRLWLIIFSVFLLKNIHVSLVPDCKTFE